MTERMHAGIATLTAVFVVVTLAARWWNTPVAEDGSYGDDHDTVVTPLAELMGVGEWEPVYGIALEQARGEGS